ncbi:ribbon-helix-helix protein, CopG family [Rhodococcus sp. HNM0569]|uniref:ribbon-helix-helix protein, CopG family n=1 Tax=Rhodococcus sp. HNM0569 TaxID=2716340 RepID=UPI00146B11AC|nr:ribbon-helix-helix protein, CopG family [Rhodococcus sp. HNM0569]NLU82654.1 ribbon-helix-helix protein, CopG family [Rhodococcus sp. HNM0569]
MGSGEVKQFNVYLPVELIKRVKHHAVESESSLSAIVADALSAHLHWVESRETRTEKQTGEELT